MPALTCLLLPCLAMVAAADEDPREVESEVPSQETPPSSPEGPPVLHAPPPLEEPLAAPDASAEAGTDAATSMSGDPAPPDPLLPATPLRRFGHPGRVWTTIYGGALGGYVGGTLGYLLDEEEALGTGVLLGGTAGALTPILLMGRRDVDPAIPLVMASASGMGAWAGIELARTFIPPGAELEYPRIQAAGILGVAAGTGVGLLLARDPPAARDVLASDLATFVGAQMGAGLGDLLDLSLPEDRNLRAPLSLGGGAALLGASLLASRSGLTLPDPLTTWIDLGHGAWIGAWAPLLFSDHPEESQVGGGLRMGLGAGYLAAVALSPHVESSPRSASLQVGGMLAGNALGAGIPLALGAQEPARLVVGPMLAGGIAGQALGIALAPRFDLSNNDLVMISALETWTVYQAIGWGVFGAHVSEGKDTVPVGYALTAGGAGTLIAAGLAPFVELEPSESVLVASAGAWGSWYGAWAGTLFDLPSDAHWGLTLGAGNAFLVGSSLLVATSWHPTWGDVLRIDGLGLLGGSMGALAGVITSPDLDAVALGSLLGSTAGLAAGALLPGDGRARRTSGGGVLGILPEFALPFSTHVSASPWVDVEGRPGAWLQLDVTPGA